MTATFVSAVGHEDREAQLRLEELETHLFVLPEKIRSHGSRDEGVGIHGWSHLSRYPASYLSIYLSIYLSSYLVI